jgi:putative MATE family efflux protein
MVGALLGYAYGASITLKLHQNALAPKPFHNPQLGYNNPSLGRIVARRANLRRRQSLGNGKQQRDRRLSCSSESNFTDTFRDAGIEVVKSLEEAETQSLKAVSEVEELLAEADKGEPPHDSKKKVVELEPGSAVTSVTDALETIWTEENIEADPLRSLEPEEVMVAAAKVAEALEGEEEGHIPGQMYFHMLEPVSPVAAPVMVRDFSETVESSDDEEEEVVGFMMHTETVEHFEKPSVVEEVKSVLSPVDILLPDDVLPAEPVVEEPVVEEHHLEPGAVASALMVKEVADALKAPEEDNMHPVGEKSSDGAAVGDGEEKSLVEQLKDIMVFAGPALGIWMSGPIMGIIDTAVIGNSSSLELAALGPGTVLCDQVCYIFMFLSVATSNLIATSLAQKKREEAKHHLSRMLFLALACGMGLFVISEVFVTQLLQAFVGAKNYDLIPAARIYVQIRALAWPAVLVSLVAQSASLGMMDSKTPLKVLIVSSMFNLVGDVVLCSFMSYGIAGAAWATIASQYVGGILMMLSLNNKGYSAFNIQAPSLKELADIAKLTAPLLLSMISKVAFYTLVTFLATSLGATTIAAHQVMVGIYGLCAVWGEPLAQTAQSFMPPLIYGSQKNLKQAQKLLEQLVIIGLVVGTIVGLLAISIPWVCPQVFTSDPAIITQMRGITLPFIVSAMSCPPTLSLEGTLLAGRDFKFLSFSMTTCFIVGSVMLLTSRHVGWGLQGSWWTLASFQWARFVLSWIRLKGPKSIIRDAPEPQLEKEKAMVD